MSSIEGVAARTAGALLETVVKLASEASANEAADIREAVVAARDRIGALPALAPEIAAAAEARRRELAGTATTYRREDFAHGTTPGQVAFEAYNVSRGGLTHDGKPTPPWSSLGDGVRAGWEAAAEAARSAR